MNTDRLVLVGPHETYNRFKGGITVYLSQMDHMLGGKYELVKVNTVTKSVKANSRGRLTASNIINAWKVFRALRSECKPHDIVYWHTSYGNAMLKDLLLWRLFSFLSKGKHKIVFHWHFVPNVLYEGVHPLVVPLFKNSLRQNKYILLSQHLGEKLSPYNKNWDFVYNGNGLFQVPNNIKKEDQTAIYVGSIEERKDFLKCLDLLAMMPNYTLRVVGSFVSTDYQRVVMSRIDFLGLKDKVDFHGYVDDRHILEELLLSSELLLLPSRAEGLPLAVMEGAAFGCIPVISKVGSLVEIFSKDEVVWWGDDVNEIAITISGIDKERYRSALHTLSLQYTIGARAKELTRVISSL